MHLGEAAEGHKDPRIEKMKTSENNNTSKNGNCSKRQKNNRCTHPIPLRVSKFVILLSREQFPQNTFQLEQIIIVSPKST